MVTPSSKEKDNMDKSAAHPVRETVYLENQ